MSDINELLHLLCRGSLQSSSCTVSHSNCSTWLCLSIFIPWLVSVFLLSAFIFSSLLPALGLRPRPRMLDQDYGWIHLVRIALFQGDIWGKGCNASLTVIVTRTSHAAVLISEPKFCFLVGSANFHHIKLISFQTQAFDGGWYVIYLKDETCIGQWEEAKSERESSSRRQ